MEVTTTPTTDGHNFTRPVSEEDKRDLTDAMRELQHRAGKGLFGNMDFPQSLSMTYWRKAALFLLWMM